MGAGDSMGVDATRSRRFSYSADRGLAAKGRELSDVHIFELSFENLPAPYRKEPARLNWKTFGAMLARDAHVARRNAIHTLLLQTFLQPLLFVFIFGRVMVGSGYLPPRTRAFCSPALSRSAWSSPEFGR